MSDPTLKAYLTVQRRFSEAQESYYNLRSVRGHRDMLRLNFARNMAALKILKSADNAEAQRKMLVDDNKICLRMLRDMRTKHPECFDSPVKQVSFLKELTT
jgi:hypothetical protein